MDWPAFIGFITTTVLCAALAGHFFKMQEDAMAFNRMWTVHELSEFMSHEIRTMIYEIVTNHHGIDVNLLTEIVARHEGDAISLTFSFGQFHSRFLVPRDYLVPDISLDRIGRVIYEYEIAILRNEQERAAGWRAVAQQEFLQINQTERGVAGNITATEIIQRQQECFAQLAGDGMYPMMVEAAYCITNPPFQDDVKTDEALKKSLELLQEHLSEVQWKQFQRTQMFLVTGCDTGTVYKLTKAPNYNIEDVLTGEKFCFLPDGHLQIGDIMLAQKIALETMENDALKIANRNYYGAAVVVPGGLTIQNGEDLNVEFEQGIGRFEAGDRNAYNPR